MNRLKKLIVFAFLGIASSAHADLWLVNELPFKIRFNMFWLGTTVWFDRDGGLRGHSSLWDGQDSSNPDEVWRSDFRIELDPKGSPWDQAKVEGDIAYNRTRVQLWVNQTGDESGWKKTPDLDMPINNSSWLKFVVKGTQNAEGVWSFSIDRTYPHKESAQGLRNEGPLVKYPGRNEDQRATRTSYPDKK